MNRNISCLASSVFRFFLCGFALITAQIGLTDSRSLLYLVASKNDGYLLTWMMVAMAIVGIFDVLMNDIHTDFIKWDFVQNWRHFGFSALAFCYVAQIFVAQKSVSSPGLTAYYIWNALAIMLIVFIDANQRSKNSIQCSHVCN